MDRRPALSIRCVLPLSQNATAPVAKYNRPLLQNATPLTLEVLTLELNKI